ncbi:Outer membrane receptor proteins, mostly Fe transport [Tenacibaculum sp. MAR_2009_124]|uniref:outer membrane beta-barrel family protein n=1 Tax=Tenacibaculum sp. MAR_2009_124 TaxID=1250059 RepID=UPI00089A49DE|nr:outer membrane beta-barrel family protein [Tenacibaculum sp. MAR_2009_124]SEB40852.1 Outer membrane receptor proteins, mostly Fe transport [Tenacibaculum sp. MAR_2009_124]
MKRLLLLFLCLCVFKLVAQKKNFGEIHGYVYEQSKQIAIPFASVTLKSEEGKIISGSVSNKAGKFSLKKIPLGTYILDVQFMGYDPLIKNVSLSKATPKLLLKKLYLKESNIVLDGITVKNDETYIVQKIDRKIINVGKDIAATGANALQVLQNAPSVDVDVQSGSISLRGNENVRILINGKPSNMNPTQLLRQTPSALLKQIEIITTPSAKYNPEGMSGIINFVLKKNTNSGFNGSIMVGLEHSKYTRPNSTIDLNYNTGSINFFGNYSSYFGKYKTVQRLERVDKFLTQDFDFLYDYDDHTFRLGADIFLNKKNTFSIYTYQTFSDNSLSNDAIFKSDNETLYTPNLSNYNASERIYNIDYKHQLEKGGSIELETNYSVNKNPEESINRFPQDSNNRLYDYSNDIDDTRRSWLINLDFEKNIFDSIKLETGLEYRSQLMHNSINTNQEIEVGSPITIVPRGNTDFNYDRFIYSAYFNLNKEFKNLSVQAGLRFEQYNVHGSFSNTQQVMNVPYSDKEFNIYPSIFASYSISDKDNIQLAYSRRVERPAFSQVTPIQEWVSPLTTSQGNQNLNLQFTNSLEINYTKTISKGYITIGTFYRRLSNRIGRTVQESDVNPDIQILSFDNYDFADNYGAELSASYKIYKWWNVFPSIETYIQQSEGIINGSMESVKNTYFKTVLRNNFKVNNNFNAQLIINHRGRKRNIQFEIQPYTTVDIGASLSILDDKGKISLRGSDIFNGMNFQYFSGNPFPQNGSYDLENDSVYLGFSYAFGSSKGKTRSRKERDDSESQGGLF